MAHAPVEPVDLLDDDAQVLARRGGLGMTQRDLRRGAEARERIANAVRDRGRHLADGRELLGLNELRLRRLELRDLVLQLEVEPRGAARDCSRLSVICAKERARSPISSGELTSIGSSTSPAPTRAMATRSWLIGRASPREMSHDASSPATTAKTRIAISASRSPVTISSSREYAPRTLDSRACR